MLLSNNDEAKFKQLATRTKDEMLTLVFVSVSSAEWGPPPGRPEDSQLAPLPDAQALR
jgi:hypothetical protein